MIRILAALIICVLGGAGFAWLADHSAAVVLSLPDWRISFSPAGGAAFLLCIIIAILLLIYILRLLLAPLGWRSAWQRHKKAHAYRSLSESLMAAFAGDSQTAAAKEREAAAALPPAKEPLTALAQSASAEAQARDMRFFAAAGAEPAAASAKAKTATPLNAAAEKTMQAVLQEAFAAEAQTGKAKTAAPAAKFSPDVRLMALKTLFDQAQAAQNWAAAGRYAALAAMQAPGLIWASLTAAAAPAQAGKWPEALAIYEQFAEARRKQARQDSSGRQQKALDYYYQTLLCGAAAALFALQPREARDMALKAHKLNPLFAPACVVAAEILFQLDEARKAEKLLKAAWRQAPHPDLARAYARAGGGQKADEMARLAELAAEAPAGSAVATRLLAQAAFAAQKYEQAQQYAEQAAKQHGQAPDFALLAELAALKGEASAAAGWLAEALAAPAAPCWRADGQSLAVWQPLSPVRHELGACRYESPAGPAFTAAEAESLKQRLQQALAAAQQKQTQKQEKAAAAAAEESKQAIAAAEAEAAPPPHGFAPPAPASDDTAPAAQTAAPPEAPAHLNVDNPGVEQKTE